MARNIRSTIADELAELNEKELKEVTQKSIEVFQSAAQDHSHWVLAFSGGKDSTLVAILVFELLLRKSIENVQVDIVYSDTLMELPPFGDNAYSLLDYINDESKKHGLPIRTHSVSAPITQRFWFLIIGKGYPPPHNHFRWCTDRLKILPSRRIMKELINDTSIVLTGVRMGESDNRDGRLKAALCSKSDSECGQGAWYNGDSEMGIPGLAPIVHWRTCQVWDFLMVANRQWNWPLTSLTKMYGDSPATRFGCWMCTLVREDKALIAVTSQNEWKHLSALSDVRSTVLEEGRKEENRIFQPNGNIGRTSLSFRGRLLEQVLKLQDELGTALIDRDEVRAIQAYWKTEVQLGSPYNNDCKFWKWTDSSD